MDDDLNSKKQSIGAKMKNKKSWLIGISIALIVLIAGSGAFYYYNQTQSSQARQFAREYTKNFAQKKYSQLLKNTDKNSLKAYGLTDKDPSAKIEKSFDYLGIENIKVSDVKTNYKGGNRFQMTYNADLKTPAGMIKNQRYVVNFKINKKQATVIYNSNLILSGLAKDDHLNIAKDGGQRGQILDRNGKVLAGTKITKELKIVPQYFLNKDGSINQDQVDEVAKKYNATSDEITKGINAYSNHPDWAYTVKSLGDDDYQKDDDGDGASVQSSYEREYPLGAAASLLIGYTSTATSDDVAKDATLSGNDIVGRAGLEKAYDKQLRGKETIKYQILNQKGEAKKTLLYQKFEKGQDIKLTIDSDVQKATYDGFNDVPGSAVIQAPKTGDLLAVVSTPSYDPTTLTSNNNADYPFMARFAKGYAPASTFKQVSAAIGLSKGTLNPDEVIKIEGTKWTPYNVTRVNSDTEVNLKTALQHSDNVYFAQQMLKVGRDTFQSELTDKFTFGRDYKLPITMKAASFSNTGKLEDNKQLADSAYGQAQMSVNPIEMVTMFNFLDNDGNIVMPKLIKDDKKPVVIKDAVKSDDVKTILDDEVGIVSDEDGYAHNLYNEGYNLAAKTGTAETGNNNQNALVSIHDLQNNKFTGIFVVENSVVNGENKNPQADDVAKNAVDYLENTFVNQ